MRHGVLALLALPALLLGAGEGRAQQISSPYQWLGRTQGVGPFVGYLWTTPTVNINPDEEAEFGPQPAPVVGIQYRGRLTGPLDAHVAVSFAPSERKVIVADSGRVAGRVSPTETGDVADMPLLFADAGLRLNVTGPRTWRGLQPYVVGTAGVVTWLSGRGEAEEEVEADQRFDFGPSLAVSFKAGTDWFPSRRFSVNVELSDHIWQVDVPGGFRFVEDAVETEWKNNYGVSIGGSFHF